MDSLYKGTQDDPDVYEEEITNGFHWLDYVVFTLTLVIALGIGVYHSVAGGGQKTTSQYLMGDRQLRPFPVALSIFMSVISGILVLGTSAEMYIYGTQLWLDPVARGFMYAISARLFVPMMHRLKLTSVFEYHMRRYNSEVLHLMCVVISIIYSLTYMGMAMYAPATALEAVTGFPVWASLVCTGVVAVIYTTIGGMKAVVWTDFFQAFILFAGLITVLVVGCVKVGGLDKVWEISKQGGRINFFDMNPDPTERATFWTVMFGSGLMALLQSANEQTQIQRYCALPTVKDATMVVLLQIPLILAVYTLVCLCGLTAYAYYDMIECDPYRSYQISNTNQLLPFFVVDAIGVKGLTGLFVAVLFSGALSSISSSMSALAAITWKDILEKHLSSMTESRKTVVTKLTALVYGSIGVLMGFVMQFFRGNVMQLATALLSGLSGPLGGVIIAGSIFPWVQSTGMIIGLISGILVFLWINIGQFITYPHREYLDTNVDNCTFGLNETAREIESNPEDIMWVYRLSFQYIPLASLLTTVSVGVIASLITGKNDPKTVDPMTMVNLGAQCGCCYSASCQKSCRFGIPFDEDSEYQEKMADDEEINEMKEDKVNGYGNKAFMYDNDDVKISPEKNIQSDRNVQTENLHEKLNGRVTLANNLMGKHQHIKSVEFETENSQSLAESTRL